jgi:Cu(I)/Ag(I) efflux system membrane fusion protein
MHPQYTSDKPGECPICHMRLVPIEASSTGNVPSVRKILYYRNPMNPQATSPTPAKDSMGMDYVPVYNDEVKESSVSGQAMVNMNVVRQQMIGVQTSPVERRGLTQSIRASARVAYDPGLYSAILEHQQAVSALAKLPTSANSEYWAEAESTVSASRLRLRQMGLSDSEIDRLSRDGNSPANLLLGSRGGTVWVYAELYDYEAGVKSGQEAELTTPAYPGQIFKGKVRSIDPILNSESRTLRARIETPNPDGLLKPEMYLTAIIHTALGKQLAVPDTAVMDTGTRQLVFVEKAPGQFDPREVRLGRDADGYFEVLSGLQEGEKVVTSANFLIDSESKLKAAAQK